MKNIINTGAGDSIGKATATTLLKSEILTKLDI